MVRTLVLGAVAILMTAAPVLAAPPVVENPGRCAAAFPNANCQNYGPGNPYSSYGWAHERWHHWHHRYHHRHWR